MWISKFCITGLFLISIFITVNGVCNPSATTVSGTFAPTNFCSGDLIFEETFDTLDLTKWRHEVTMAGGGNYEFQWYVNNRSNSYVDSGNLHIQTTLTSDIYGEAYLTSGHVVIPSNVCTASFNYGCNKQATTDNIIPPIQSARIDTKNSFAFKFGKLEIRAKLPTTKSKYLWILAEIGWDWFVGNSLESKLEILRR